MKLEIESLRDGRVNITLNLPTTAEEVAELVGTLTDAQAATLVRLAYRHWWLHSAPPSDKTKSATFGTAETPFTMAELLTEAAECARREGAPSKGDVSLAETHLAILRHSVKDEADFESALYAAVEAKIAANNAHRPGLACPFDPEKTPLENLALLQREVRVMIEREARSKAKNAVV